MSAAEEEKPPRAPSGTSGATFRYVLIPADDGLPIQELNASKSGGLTHDALVAHAREYFAQLRDRKSSWSGGTPVAASGEYDAPKERAVRQLRATTAPSCDIAALTIPNERNGYAAVSLYKAMLRSADSASENDGDPNPAAESLPINRRATQLAAACGHTIAVVRGDAFVGRAHDDEMGGSDWERIDFPAADADPSSEWCRVASSPGGGGGGTGASSSSLSGLLSSGAAAAVGGADAGQSRDELFGLNGVPVPESWGSWTQGDEEVELKFAVDAQVTAKQVQVQFGRHSVSVRVLGQTLLEGKPFDAIVADDSTYTLQSSAQVRELCVMLAKAQEGRTWSWAVR